MGARYNRESIFCYDILTSGPKYHLCQNLNLTLALKSSHFVQMVAALATTKLDMALVLLAPPSDSENQKIIQGVRHIYSSGKLMPWISELSWLRKDK